jgi:sugar phosphate isomerase/epimerase
MRRREFMTTSALAASAFFLPSWVTARGKSKQIGIQLYTVRDLIVNDPVKTLTEISKIGYTQLEPYSYADGKIYGLAYTEFSNVVKDLGMKIVSGHYSTGLGETTKGNLRNGWEDAVADAKGASQKYMVIPSLYSEEMASIDALKKVCELMNKGGEVCKKYGIRLGFHNHASEFKMLEGQLIYDVMLQELDPKLVTMELDLFWIINAGYDPLQYFKKYPGRFELWHVKDMEKENRNSNADLGAGSIDFKSIFAQAKQSGMKHFFMEQENYNESPMISVKNGFDYLNTLHAHR